MKNRWLPPGSWIAQAAAAQFVLGAAMALAQGTPYGEDAIPNSNESLRARTGYGTDPVPSTEIENGYTIRAYGFDLVPSTPRGDFGQIVPNQTLQVITGAVEDSPARPAGSR